MTRGAEVGGGDEVLVIWQSCLMEEPVTLEETKKSLSRFKEVVKKTPFFRTLF